MRKLLFRLMISSRRVRHDGPYRCMSDWCDYGAHYRVRYEVWLDGQRWGQSCLRHVGSLSADAVETARSREIDMRPSTRHDNRLHIDWSSV